MVGCAECQITKSSQWIAAKEIPFMMLQLSILFILYYVKLCFSHVQQVFLSFPVIFLFVFLSFCKNLAVTFSHLSSDSGVSPLYRKEKRSF